MRKALLARGGYAGVSLDEPGTVGGDPLADRLGEAEEGYEQVEAALMVQRAVARLHRGDRDILFQRFVQCRSQADIAARRAMTQMAVSRRLVKILATLRADLEGAGATEQRAA